MKVYLDTNMLYFLLLKNNEDISPAVNSILSDYHTVLCTSSVCVHELIHLCHIGKVPVGKKKSALKNAHDVLTWLNDMNIGIVAVSINDKIPIRKLIGLWIGITTQYRTYTFIFLNVEVYL